MITYALLICIAGLVVYYATTKKTNREFCEDVGRIAFGVALLAWLLLIGGKTL